MPKETIFLPTIWNEHSFFHHQIGLHTVFYTFSSEWDMRLKARNTCIGREKSKKKIIEVRIKVCEKAQTVSINSFNKLSTLFVLNKIKVQWKTFIDYTPYYQKVQANIIARMIHKKSFKFLILIDCQITISHHGEKYR